MKKIYLFLLLCFLSIPIVKAQYTSIPDQDFERMLIIEGLDDILDGQVLTAKIDTVKSLNVYNGWRLSENQIKDLKGIEGFTALTDLNCQGNALTSLDLSQNYLLKNLNCSSNDLTSLNLTSNTQLEQLNCTENQLSALILSNNLLLTDLECSYNNLKTLNLTSNSKLVDVDSDNNQLRTILFSTNSVITSLDCQDNFLETLDISTLSSLSSIYIGNNPLTCVQVKDQKTADDANNDSYYYWQEEDYTTYSTFCTQDFRYTLIPDSVFEKSLIDGHYDIVKDGRIRTSIIEKITNLSVSNYYWIADSLKIKDLSGIQNFSALKKLDCSGNTLTSLNIINNVSLEELNCSYNQLTNLNLVSNLKLKELECSDNALTSLNLVSNTQMTNLDCKRNEITSLNLSSNPLISSLNCTDNKLTELDLSSQTNLVNLHVRENRILCVQLNDQTKVNLANIDANGWFEDDYTKYAVTCVPDQRYTSIPDTVFENRLIAKGIDDVFDGKVRTAFIETLKSLYVSESYWGEDSLKIKDFTGIQDFKSLKRLDCSGNLLRSLDLSQNTQLKDLDCERNQISNLDLSNNILLTDLDCSDNNLTELDLSLQTELTSLDTRDNRILCVQVSSEEVARLANADENNWEENDYTKYAVTCIPDNRYTSIPDSVFEQKLIENNIDDIQDGRVHTAFIELVKSLNLPNNSSSEVSSSIKDLTGIEAFTSLERLTVDRHQLRELDLSKNTQLSHLVCSENLLVSLDLSTNTKLSWVRLEKNPLICVKVSSDSVATEAKTYASNWDEENYTSYTTGDCTGQDDLYTSIPDLNFERGLILNGYDYEEDGQALTRIVEWIRALDLSGQGVDSLKIKDLTGIHAFLALSSFSVKGNLLTSLDISKNTQLSYLLCGDNQISNLELSKNTQLKKLHCENNQITSLDLSNNPLMTNLDFSENLLTSLDLSGQTMLDRVDVSQNPLVCVKVSSDSVAVHAKSSDTNEWSEDDYTSYTAGNCMDDDDRYTSIPDVNFERRLVLNGYDTEEDGQARTVILEKIKGLYLYDQGVDSLKIKDLTGIEAFTALEVLNVRNNLLKQLDLSKNINLRILNSSSNELTELKLNENTALEELTFNDNNVKTLDLSNNTKISEIYCYNNEIELLDLSTLNQLKKLDLYNNKLTELNLSEQDSLNYLYAGENPLSCIQLANQTMVDSANANARVNNGFDPFWEPNGVGYSLDCASETYYNITAEESEFGDISFDSPRVLEGQSLHLSILPKKGYELSELRINNSIKQVEYHSYLIEEIGEDIIISATYREVNDWYTLIPDPVFEKMLVWRGYDDVVDGRVQTLRIEGVESLNLYDGKLQSLVGIQDFTSLSNLYISWNSSVENLNLSENLKLKTLSVQNGKLKNLSLPKTDSLSKISVDYNQLRNIDLSGLKKLQRLNLVSNNLRTIDLSDLDSLSYFNSQKNLALSCIKVGNQALADSLNAGNVKGWYKDYESSYSVNSCDFTYHTLTASENSKGWIFLGTNKVISGDTASFRVLAKDGYRIQNVYVDGQNVGAVSAYAIKNIQNNVIVTVDFAEIDENTTFKLSYKAPISGSISLSQTEVKAGETATVTITADAGYRIKDVLMNGFSVGKVSSYTISNILENKSIEAIFEKAEGVAYYSLSVLPSKGGYIELDKSSNIEEGEDVKFSIESNEGYAIKDVLVNGKSVGISNTFTLTDIREDKIIQALFEEANEESIFNLTYETPVNGSISLDKTEVKFGEDATVTITADSGYRVKDVLINGTSVGRVNSYILADVQEDKKVVAVFEELIGTVTYNLDAKISLHGSIVLSKTEANEGESATVTITANEGYLIKDVLVNGKSVGAVDTYTISDIREDKTVEAIFVEKSSILSSGKSDKLQLYPNPVTDDLKIMNTPKGSLIRVINLQGQVLKSEISEGKLTTLDLSDLKEGVYLVLVEGQKAQKIVKK